MIRFGIAGTGRISDWVLQGAVLDPRFKAVAVCSRSERTATSFIQRHPEAFVEGSRAYTCIDEMAADPDIDAVYIGTPNVTHYSYAMAAIRSGKHVLCEKPMACSLSEVSSLIDAARSEGVVLMEAMISTLQPSFRAAAQQLQALGEIRHASFNYCQYSTKYDDLRERGIAASSLDPAMGGGAIEDLGIYTIYPLVSLFGEPDRVEGARALMLDTPHGPVDVQGAALLHFPEDFTASVVWSKAADGYSPSEICGSRGNLLLDSVHICRESRYIPHGAPASGRGNRPEGAILCSADGTDEYYYEWREFMDTIESGRVESPINTLKTSLTTRKVMDKIIKLATH